MTPWLLIGAIPVLGFVALRNATAALWSLAVLAVVLVLLVVVTGNTGAAMDLLFRSAGAWCPESVVCND